MEQQGSDSLRRVARKVYRQYRGRGYRWRCSQNIAKTPTSRIFGHAPSGAAAPLDAMACRKFHETAARGRSKRNAVTGPAGQHRFSSGFPDKVIA
jgi:hypothetical protein